MDLGGNIGSADIVFHCAYPDAEFIVVEPVPANVAMLRKNWADNGIKGRIVEAAATGKPGARTFFLGNPDCSSLLNRDDLTDGSITVKCVTVPQLLDEAGWDTVDLMKIDIEGGEIEVFQSSGSWAHRVDMMIGELHNGYSVKDAERDLNEQFELTQTFEYPTNKMVGFLGTRKR